MPATRAPKSLAAKVNDVAFGVLVGLALVALFVGAGFVVRNYALTTSRAIRSAPDLLADFHAACAARPAPTPTEPPLVPTAEPAMPADGRVIAELRIDALDLVWPVVAGVADADLARGVGWYPQTSAPGLVGNFAVAGNRMGNGEPFRNLPNLATGDQIVITTCTERLVYALDNAPSEITVQDTDDWVLDALPGQPGEYPNTPLITLTTSQDLLPTADRSVAFGHLVERGAA